jgi:multiple antibiotic resistance protein
MNLTTAVIINFCVAMLAITNPIGNLGIFLGLTGDKSLQEQRKTAIHAAISIAIILVLVVWIGHMLLGFFGISTAAFESAGALIILLLGLSMMHGGNSSPMHHTQSEHENAKIKDAIAVVPLAIPIVAGPGAITTIIIHSHQFATVSDKLLMSGLCLINALILGVAFYFAPVIGKLLGEAGIKIVTRLMGLILSAMAFDMLGHGLAVLLPGLA